MNHPSRHIIVALVSVAVLGACKKGDDATAKMTEFRDKMCACADKKDGAADCAKKVSDDMTKWSADNASKGDNAAKASDELTEITKKFTECATKAASAGAPSMGGSGGGMVAGSGGGDTMAGGSGGASGGGSAAPAAGGIASTDDYNAKELDMVNKFKDAYGQADCDKAAAAIGPLFEQNHDAIAALRAWQRDHTADEKAFDDAHKDIIDPMKATAKKCKDNAAFQAAMAKMPH